MSIEKRAAVPPAVADACALSVRVVPVMSIMVVPAGTFAETTYMPMQRPVALATVAEVLRFVVLIVVETWIRFAAELPMVSRPAAR